MVQTVGRAVQKNGSGRPSTSLLFCLQTCLPKKVSTNDTALIKVNCGFFYSTKITGPLPVLGISRVERRIDVQASF